MNTHNLKYFTLIFFVLCKLNAKAQTDSVNNIVNHQRVTNIIPRIGIGVSRHFIAEVGIAYMRSNFGDHKTLGFNTNNWIYYFGFEALTPYKKPNIYAYKIGFENVNLGHITSAGGIEFGYYQKDTSSSFVIMPKIGIPLINGSLSYGFGLFVNTNMRKEIGKHRITLSYCFNRKSDKTLSNMLDKHKRRYK